MGTDGDTASLYDAAMGLSRAAFAGRHYAVAYHALAAALHAAFDYDDDRRLAVVAAVAHEQGAWLDEHDPGNELSARSAAARGSRGLWLTLEEDAQLRRGMLAQRILLQRLHLPAGAGGAIGDEPTPSGD